MNKELNILSIKAYIILTAIAITIVSTLFFYPKDKDTYNNKPNISIPSDISILAERSNKWDNVRDTHIKYHPKCEVCGATQELNVHHIQPFHTNPELELYPPNLITLCRKHHFEFGHDPDGPWGTEKPAWTKINPNVWNDISRYKYEQQ